MHTTTFLFNLQFNPYSVLRQMSWTALPYVKTEADSYFPCNSYEVPSGKVNYEECFTSIRSNFLSNLFTHEQEVSFPCLQYLPIWKVGYWNDWSLLLLKQTWVPVNVETFAENILVVNWRKINWFSVPLALWMLYYGGLCEALLVGLALRASLDRK